MMKLRYAILLLSACLAASAAMADTLELKNGSLIKGQYVGGTETQISLRVGSSVQNYAVSDVLSLKFDSPAVSTPAPGNEPQLLPRASQNDPAPPPTTATTSTYDSASANKITAPTGTRIVVRTIDEIDSSKNRVGDKFQASLEQPLYVNEMLVAPKGADVYGRLEEAKEAGHIQGKSQLKLTLTGIVINGQTVALSTGDYEVAGKSRGTNTAKKVGGGAAVGAVIGAIAGGGKGAAIGAGVGAGAGTAVQVMTKGDQVHVPSETLLEFALDQPITLPISQAPQTR
ncbi:MAG: hypothetical protein DMG65_11915 [Candidatus Angelobacter sp. Gp1-AA117]|nr:MAG: hypothetical protein DMG65_11915 [Candidatus Angelobacter sp. Gp1-AA117]